MTDKTDIASLMRDMRDLANRIVECQGENSDGEEITRLYDQSDTTFKAQNILLVLSAFEEQRQRADANAQEIRKLEFQWEHRAPTQWAYDQACSALHAHRERAEKADAKLANPVVLPPGYSVRGGHPFHEGERNVMIPNKNGDWLSRFDVEHAIHVAGFTVKGE